MVLSLVDVLVSDVDVVLSLVDVLMSDVDVVLSVVVEAAAPVVRHLAS